LSLAERDSLSVDVLHELFGLEGALRPEQEAPAEVTRLDARRQR